MKFARIWKVVNFVSLCFVRPIHSSFIFRFFETAVEEQHVVGLPSSLYEVHGFIGKSVLSDVYSVVDKNTKELLAAKVYSIDDESSTPKVKEGINNLIGIWMPLKHEHIMELKLCFEHEHRLVFILELCEGGHLYGRLTKGEEEPLTESQVRVYMRQLVSAVLYLHSNLIIHRKIHLRNIFLTNENILKLGGFDAAVRLTSPQDSISNRMFVQDPSHWAPERRINRLDSLPCDVYSLGAVMVGMLTGGQRYSLFPTLVVSSSGYSAIRRLMDNNPVTRIAINKILDLPWFKEEDKETDVL